MGDFFSVALITKEAMNTSRRHLLGSTAAFSLLPALSSWAQATWPNKAVRIVVPFAAGGTTDILARALAPEFARTFGQPFVVDNKPGAGGNSGAAEVAKAAPDGYTLLMGTVGTHAINPALYPKMPYDHQRDFAPVTLVAGRGARGGDRRRRHPAGGRPGDDLQRAARQ